MTRPMLTLVATLAFAAPAIAVDADCTAPDYVTRIPAREHCLVIRSHGTPPTSPDPVLAVFLHGDMAGGDASAAYLDGYASRFADANTISVTMIRQGYADGGGHRSTGDNLGRRDAYTSVHMDGLAAAVAGLRAHHRARRVVMIGHGGGAAIIANILGREAGLVDAAVLVGCPCDIPAWRAHHDPTGREPWIRSVSPHLVIHRIPDTAVVTVAVGERDTDTIPALSRDYAAALARRGIKARFLLLRGAGHDIDATVMENEILADAIRAAIKAP